MSSEDHRHPIESIASSVAGSIREGKRVEIDPIVEANPNLEGELRGLIPVIRRLENARRQQAERPGGMASLGASRPRQLGDFRLVRQIGRGGMGVVFEAVQQSLGRIVAVKVLPKSLLVDEDQLKRFEREAKTAGSLHHTNIVPVFGVGVDQGFHYYVMQLIDGQGLDRAICDDDHFSPDRVAKFGQQAASALACAHEQNVLHRDIKPANLIVDAHDHLWVTDFGVAKAIESEGLTRIGDVVGTLRYMAPEQIVGASDVRSDIYSLGVTLYELLAGRPAIDDTAIRQALVSRVPPPAPPRLRQLNSEVSRDLETILQTAMSAEVDRRYSTAAEMASDLQHYLDGEPISVRPMSKLESVGRWARRNPAVASLSVFSLMLLTGVAALSTFGYFRLQSALTNEKFAREAAEDSADLTSEALRQIFDGFSTSPEDQANSPAEFSSAPALSAEVAHLLQELIPYYDELAARDSSDEQLRQATADAHYALGDIHYQLGQYQESIKSFERAIVSQPADGEPNGALTSAWKEARIRNRIGLAYRMLGDRDAAKGQHATALELLGHDSAVADKDSPDSLYDKIRFERARAHYLYAARLLPGMGPLAMPPLKVINQPSFEPLLGLPVNEGSGPPGRRPPPRDPIGRPPRDAIGRPPRGDLMPLRPYLLSQYTDGQQEYAPDEEPHLRQATTILRRLHEEDREHAGYAVALAACLRKLVGDSIPDRTEGEWAMEAEAIDLLRSLHELLPEDATVRSELAAALGEFTVFSKRMTMPEMDLTIERLQEAATHWETLSSIHPNVPTYTNHMAHTQFQLGVMLDRFAALCLPQDRHQLHRQAGDAFRQAARRYVPLLVQYPDAPGYRAWSAVFLQRQGETALIDDRYDEAELALSTAIDQWLLLTESHPDELISWQSLPHAFQTLSRVQRALKKDDEAEESEMKAILVRMAAEGS